MSDHGLEDVNARLADEYPSPDTSRPLTLPSVSLGNEPPSGGDLTPIVHVGIGGIGVGAGIGLNDPPTQGLSQDGHHDHAEMALDDSDMAGVAVSGTVVNIGSGNGHGKLDEEGGSGSGSGRGHGQGHGHGQGTVLGIGVGVQPHVEEMAINTGTISFDDGEITDPSLAGMDPHAAASSYITTEGQHALSSAPTPTATAASASASVSAHIPIPIAIAPHSSDSGGVGVGVGARARSNPHGTTATTTPGARQAASPRALHTFYSPTPQAGRAPSAAGMSHTEQITLLREAFLRNPLPSKAEMQHLADQTGRPFVKVRQYFAQRRAKGRGLDMVEELEEPARAAGWLQYAYRAASADVSVSQLGLYGAYKARFDPYSQHSPLLGGQELIQMALATFPGSEMARDDGEYVLRGMGERQSDTSEAGQGERQGQDQVAHASRVGTEEIAVAPSATSEPAQEATTATDAQAVQKETLRDALERMQQAVQLERGGSSTTSDPHPHPHPHPAPTRPAPIETLVEPLRATTWLLGEYESGSAEAQPDDASDPATTEQDPDRTVTQTELYASYATRFAVPHTVPAPSEQPEDATVEPPNAMASSRKAPARILSPTELFALARLTFPSCEPAIDEDGRFVVRGLERRTSVKDPVLGEMFPFALTYEPSPSDPLHPMTSLLKRKLGEMELASTDATGAEDGAHAKRTRSQGDDDLASEDRQLVEGLQRFRRSKLGQEVRDVCVSQ